MKRLLFVLLLLALLLPAGVLAATSTLPISFTPASVEDKASIQAVSLWQTSSKKTHLFLPSDWDASQLRIWYSGEGSLSVDGQTISSGAVVSAFKPEASVKIRYGTKSCTVQVHQSANVATVYLTTESGTVDAIHQSKANKEKGSILITDAQGNEVCRQELTQVKCRGNTSFRKPAKKSYQFKLTTGKNLFGHGKSKTWLLITGYRDRSFLRNVIASELASYVGLQYVPGYTFCDVYINSEYKGFYLLAEKVQIGSKRIAINDLEEATEKLNDQPLSSYKKQGAEKATAGTGKYYAIPNDPQDITGGYLIRLEALKHYKEVNSSYVTTRAFQCQIVSPDYVSKAQYDYISPILQSFEDAIWAKDGKDPKTGKHYSEIANVESFVLKYMLEEVVKSYDANHNSQYIYKPADSQSTLLYAGPPWDYDTSWGSYASAGKDAATNPEGWWVKSATSKVWYPALYRHEEFQKQVIQAWKTRYLPALSILLGETSDITGRMHSIDEYASLISTAASNDFIRWPTLKDFGGVAVQKTGTTFRSNITYLKGFVTQRRAWLIKQWGQ